MCVESDGCEIEGCSSSDEVRTLSGSMSPGLKSNPDLHPCKPGQKFRAALLRCRSPAAAAGILSFGNVLNYMDRYTVAGVLLDIQRHYEVTDSGIGLLQTGNTSLTEHWRSPSDLLQCLHFDS
uniref:SPNS lysolipid transporter 2, sphingosine-1-phosphate n=1 Tax=Acanthochromis polyacanthus TaxID=80966 RepID=A0A3Q1FYL7_9TELE